MRRSSNTAAPPDVYGERATGAADEDDELGEQRRCGVLERDDVVVAGEFEECVNHFPDGGAVRVGVDRQALDRDLQRVAGTDPPVRPTEHHNPLGTKSVSWQPSSAQT